MLQGAEITHNSNFIAALLPQLFANLDFMKPDHFSEWRLDPHVHPSHRAMCMPTGISSWTVNDLISFSSYTVYWFSLSVRAKDCICRVGVLQLLCSFLMYPLFYFPLYDFHHPLLPQIWFLPSLCLETSHFLSLCILINVFVSFALLYFTVEWLHQKAVFCGNHWGLDF